MQSDDDTEGGEISFDYVPKRQRASHAQQQRPTVYELERDAKVAQVLAQHSQAATGDQAQASDAVPGSAAGMAACTSCDEPRDGCDEAANNNNNNSGTRDNDNAFAPPQERRYERRVTSRTAGRGRFANTRPPFHSLTPQEQQRQRTYHRNMYVMRNALREVDPETRELMQLRSNPADDPRGGRAGGRGGDRVACYRGRGYGQRGRGRGMHRGGYGEAAARGRGRGRGGEGYKRPRY